MSKSTLLAIVMVVALSAIGGLALFSLEAFYGVVLGLSALLLIVYLALRRRRHEDKNVGWH
jgi:4-hydroxybenzoate polyprenyltransferase